MGVSNMVTDDDEYKDEIHRVVGNVIRVADELGVLVSDLKLRGGHIYDVMREIEDFMKQSLDTDNMREVFRQVVEEKGTYYYFFNKLCDAISEEDLEKMLIREKMVVK